LQSLAAGIASESDPMLLADAVDVVCAAFSPDGKMFGAGSRATNTAKARVWRVSDGQLLRELDHPRTISQIVFEQKNDTVATVSEDGLVRRWAMADGRLMGQVKLAYGHISRIAFTPDGQQMLVGDSEGSISCWEVGSSVRRFDLAKHSGAVTALACTSDGRTVAAAWDTGTIRTWDFNNHRPGGELLRLDRHTRMVAFRPNTRQMLVAAEPHLAVLWELPDLLALAPPLNQGRIESVALSPDGKTAVTGSANRTAVLRDAATGKPFGKVLNHKGVVRQARFRPPDGATVLTASYDGTARLWDARDGKPRGTPLEHRRRPQDRIQVEAAAFSADGKFALTGDSTGTVRAWDGDTGELVRVFEGAAKRNGTATSVCFDQSGTRVIAGFSAPDNAIWACDFATGEMLWSARHQNAVRRVAISPDNRLVISASNDETARFWDLSDGHDVGRQMQHRGQVFVAGFSPNGKLAVTGGYDGTVRLWEVPTGKPVGEGMQHEGIVMAAAFSADGQRLLTGSADRSARLWDVATCLPLVPPLVHNDVVLSVALSPDSRTAFTGRFWRLPSILPDEPSLIDLWLQLATSRKFSAGDNIEWLEPAALTTAANEFRQRAGKAWDEWTD